MGFFVRYARQAAAVLARAEICRATDSERLCRELAAIRPASGCPRQATAVLARADICRATDSERLCRELAAIRPASGCRARTGRYLPGNGQRQAMPGAACSIALDRRDFSLSDLPFSFFKSFFGLRKKHWVCQKFQDAGCKDFSGSEHSPVGKR